MPCGTVFYMIFVPPASQPQRGDSSLAPGVSRGSKNQDTIQSARGTTDQWFNTFRVIDMSCLRHFCAVVILYPRLTPGAKELPPRCGWDTGIPKWFKVRQQRRIKQISF